MTKYMHGLEITVANTFSQLIYINLNYGSFQAIWICGFIFFLDAY